MDSKGTHLREEVYSTEGEEDEEDGDYEDEEEDGFITDSDVDAAEEGRGRNG